MTTSGSGILLRPDDVAGELRSGMTIGIGGWGSRRTPMALVRAILRSTLKDLTIVSYTGPDVGLLVDVDVPWFPVDVELNEKTYWAQIDVVREALSAERPELLEQERRRHDGRPRVEREAVLPVHVGAATRRGRHGSA